MLVIIFGRHLVDKREARISRFFEQIITIHQIYICTAGSRTRTLTCVGALNGGTASCVDGENDIQNEPCTLPACRKINFNP